MDLKYPNGIPDVTPKYIERLSSVFWETLPRAALAPKCFRNEFLAQANYRLFLSQSLNWGRAINARLNQINAREQQSEAENGGSGRALSANRPRESVGFVSA